MKQLHRVYLLIIVLLFSLTTTAQEKRITLNVSDITLAEAFAEIENQTGYSIAYASSGLDTHKRVTLSLTDVPLGNALEIMLKDTGRIFRIRGNHILIVPPEKQKRKEKRNKPTSAPLKTIIEPERTSLYEKHYILNEVIVTGSAIVHNANRSSYLVTAKMREKASNAFELIGQIHDLRYDRVSNSIKTANGKEVRILVNGMQLPEEQIRNLSPERIERIEIITEPGGRHAGTGHAAVINILLKEDYKGYDMILHNTAIAVPGNNNGNDWLANEQPGAGITYSNNRTSIFANYTYTHTRWNMPVWKQQELKETTSISSEGPGRKAIGNLYGYNSNYLGGGVNYQLNNRHNLSLQMDYLSDEEDNKDRFTFTETDNLSETTKHLQSLTTNRTKSDDYVGTVFYRGNVNDRLRIYSDFTYNYYANRVQSNYQQSGADTRNRQYRERKNYTELNTEGNYTFSPEVQFNMLYTNVWRKYHSTEYNYNVLLNHNEYRNKVVATITYSPNSRTSLAAGLGAEHIQSKYDGNSKERWHLHPFVRIGQQIGKRIGLTAACNTSTRYPGLFQLSPATTIADSLMSITGNPELKAALTYNFSLSLAYLDRLTLKAAYRYTENGISEVINAATFRTFDNIRMQQLLFQVAYDQPLGEHVTLKNSFSWSHDKASRHETRNSCHTRTFESELGYFHPVAQTGASLNYCRGMTRNILLQGYHTTGLDYWSLNLNKQFRKQQASLAVSCYLPIDWGIRSIQVKEIETPFYTERYEINIRPYQHILLVRFNLRFNSGRVNRAGKASSVDKEKRTGRTVDF